MSSRHHHRAKALVTGAIAASALALSLIIPSAASAGCPIWGPHCYHYGGTFKTKKACDRKGTWLEQGAWAAGTGPGFYCIPVPPSGHYDLYYWTP